MTDNSTQFPVRFPVLGASQYLAVLDRASEKVRSQIRPPLKKNYQAESVSIYPRWYLAGIITVLLMVLTFSFVISAGKQAAAMGLILDPLPGKFSHLSALWSNLSIAFMLALSELGTVLFLVAAGTLGRTVEPVRIGSLCFNPLKWSFRFFAVLCAAYAIVSNTTITALDLVQSAVVLQWLVTLGIPSIVLGLGMMLERMIVDALDARSEAQAYYKKAYQDYEMFVADPTLHPNYPVVLTDMLYQEMLHVRAVQGIIKSLIDADPRYKGRIVSAEYKSQQEAAQIDLNIDVSALVLPVAYELPRIEAKSVSRRVSSSKTDTGATDKAFKWLEANPGHGLSIRKAASEAGVSAPAMQRAMKQFSSNGHNKE